MLMNALELIGLMTSFRSYSRPCPRGSPRVLQPRQGMTDAGRRMIRASPIWFTHRFSGIVSLSVVQFSAAGRELQLR